LLPKTPKPRGLITVNFKNYVAKLWLLECANTNPYEVPS